MTMNNAYTSLFFADKMLWLTIIV